MAAEDVALGLDPQSVAAEMAEGIMDHQTTDKATEVMLTREAGIAAHQEKGPLMRSTSATTPCGSVRRT